MITPKQFIDDFLQARNIEAIDGRALYQYRTTHAEFQTLLQVVTQFEPVQGINNANHQHWCACFTLWCSEFYRRNYEGSEGFSYAEFWEELEFQFDAQQRADAIRIGLVIFWKRELATQDNGTAYLASLFREGGLPIKLVADGNGRFSDALKIILKQYYKVALGALPVSKLVEPALAALPQAFSNEESSSLIALCAKHLYSLAESLEEHANNAHPVEYLNEHFPTWREEFPLLLDFNAADDLIQNWLTSAKQGVKETKRIKARLRCKSYLQLQPFKVITEVTMPESMQLDLLQADISGSRASIALQQHGNTLHQFAPGYFNFVNGTKLNTRASQKRLVRQEASSPLYLNLSVDGTDIDNIQLENSALDFANAPQVFVKENGEYKYIGQNTVLTRHPEVYVVLPKSCEVSNELAQITEAQELDTDFGLLQLFKLQGNIRIVNGDNRYRIATNHQGMKTGLLMVKGKELPYPTKPSTVFLGEPKVVDQEGTSAAQHGLNVTINSVDDCSFGYGVNQIKVTNADGDTLLNRKIAILPADLSFKFTEDNHNSIVHFYSQHNMISKMLAQGCEVKRSNLEGGKAFAMVHEGALPPANCTLKLQPSLGASEVEIELPYPKTGHSVYLADGEALPKVITLNRLLGAQLNLFSRTAGAEFVLELRLDAVNKVRQEYKFKVDKKPLKIGLNSFKEDIKRLLSYSANLDSFVELAIHHNASSTRLTRVKRYEYYVKQLECGSAAILDSAAFNEQWLATDEAVYFMQPNVPERSPVKLEKKLQDGIAVDCYEIPAQFKGQGGIVYSAEDSEVSFRPTFIQGETRTEFEGTAASLQQAALTYHPRTNNDVFTVVLDAMANDFMHPSWAYLKDLYTNYNHLPLSTFVVWKEISKHSGALAMLMFKFEFDEDFIERLNTEIPILWEASKLSSWQEAYALYKDKMHELLPTETMRNDLLADMAAKLKRLNKLLPEAFLAQLHGDKVEKIPPQIALNILYAQAYNLLVNDTRDYYSASENMLNQSDFKQYPDIHFQQVQLWKQIIVDYPLLEEVLNKVTKELVPAFCYPIICAMHAKGVLEDIGRVDIYQFHELKLLSTDWFESAYSMFLHLDFNEL
ncbi:STY4851/ECs_5259 family protein [Paraferrimonas sp. SM1919]|uniref:STY4851/ECs_5259 family protein n=1 Tax=Paraferrimonas sp. SM1919 TaxID=2662263 RepID=UPI0013D2DA36|nr:STY4851/ECs_5259 family protein [Paraferrimonas sp. SM1919]